MTFLEAAAEILKSEGRPMRSDEITRIALERGLIANGGKTPEATMRAAFIMHINKGGTDFIRTAPGTYGLGKAVAEVRRPLPASKDSTTGDAGYVYILTNPSFRRDWVKIGMTVRPVNTRSKELDNTAVPLPFEIYATLKTRHRRKIEHLLHGFIDDIAPRKRIRKTREFFNIPPESALRLLVRAAEVFDEESYIDEVFRRSSSEQNAPDKAKPVRKPRPAPIGERWSGKTQLARIIARRGGNEGAAGGILHYFRGMRPCRKSCKWRRLLEEAGVQFDKRDFVTDWEHAKNPL